MSHAINPNVITMKKTRKHDTLLIDTFRSMLLQVIIRSKQFRKKPARSNVHILVRRTLRRHFVKITYETREIQTDI